MKAYRTAISVAAALVFAAALALPAVYARQAASTPASTSTNPITCDSALALLVGFAEKDLGYTLPTGVGPFDWGQYSSMFTMAMTGTPEMMATEQAASTAQASSTVTLQLPVVLGEDPQCTQVRADVVQFITNKWNGTTMSTEMPTTTAATVMPASTQAASTTSTEALTAPQATAAATAKG